LGRYVGRGKAGASETPRAILVAGFVWSPVAAKVWAVNRFDRLALATVPNHNRVVPPPAQQDVFVRWVVLDAEDAVRVPSAHALTIACPTLESRKQTSPSRQDETVTKSKVFTLMVAVKVFVASS
jgi:hypothetical protein